jgi:hypothetical protein
MAPRLRVLGWGLALVICAAGVTRCGSSTPAPSGVTTTAVTTSAVTTTSVAPITSAHYAGTLVQTPPLPPVPLDLSLFFQVPGGSLRPAIRPSAVNFLVTGGYTTGPSGFSGNISGTLDGSPANGTFTGTLTANLANGCIAKRNYSGPLTSAALNWTPGDQIETCGGASPLTFTVTPPAATTPVTTSLPTTSTIPACAYGLSIGSTIDGYPAGGTFNATVTTQAGCSWTASSNVPWINVTAGSSGVGSGTVTFTADANPAPARTGTLVIAGQTITFNQGSTTTTSTSTSTSSTTTTTSVAAAPTIALFTASPTTITAGQSATLTWGGVTNATTCSINNGVGTVSCANSTATVTPATTTTYTFTATGPGGSSTPTVTVTVTAAAPTIGSFTASPTTITAGQSATLTWSGVTNATTCSINNGVGTVSCANGAATVTPATTTTYTFTATGPGGSSTATAIVTVIPTFTLTITLSGDTAYTVTSLQAQGQRCTNTIGSTAPPPCSLTVPAGSVVLDSDHVLTLATGCTLINNNMSCSLTVNGPMPVSLQSFTSIGLVAR